MATNIIQKPLNEDSPTRLQATQATQATRPPPRQDLVFEAKFLQQPQQGRMSGLSPDSSARMLDPPLVIQVEASSREGKLITDIENNRIAMKFLCNVVLFHSHEHRPLCFANLQVAKSKTFQIYSNLMGQATRNLFYINSMEKDKKLLFVFPDLGVRLQGKYRLLCSIINIESGQSHNLMSTPFVIYTPQFYPGGLGSSSSLLNNNLTIDSTTEATALTRWLYLQGITLRTGFHSKKAQIEETDASPETSETSKQISIQNTLLADELKDEKSGH